MKIDWDLEKCIESAEIICEHYKYRRSWNGYNRVNEGNKSILGFHLSFDPNYEFFVCDKGNRHVIFNGSEQKMVNAKKYNKFYPVVSGGG